MSEFDSFAPTQENNSNAADNGFEKVDALDTPELETAEDLVSSTIEDEATPAEEEGISTMSTEPIPDDAPLVDFGFAAPVSNMPEPVQQQQESPRSPSPTSSPSPTPSSPVQLPPKKAAPASGTFQSSLQV